MYTIRFLAVAIGKSSWVETVFVLYVFYVCVCVCFEVYFVLFGWVWVAFWVLCVCVFVWGLFYVGVDTVGLSIRIKRASIGWCLDLSETNPVGHCVSLYTRHG